MNIIASARDVATVLGVRYNPRGTLAKCPLHGDKSPSFSFADGRKGQVLLHCFAGCDYRLLRAEIERLANGRFAAATTVSNDMTEAVGYSRDEYKELRCRTIWAETFTVTEGDAVWRYLTGSRRLPIADASEVPASLRYHARLDYWHDISLGEYPAMVARVDNASGELVGIHRTYLSYSTGGKAELPTGCEAKKLYAAGVGATKGAAIRLHPAAHEIVVSEGIETGMACHYLFDLPVWVAISAGNMPLIQLPDYVRSVLIAVDNDASLAGRRAAELLVSRLRKEGRKVETVEPPVRQGKSTDWADVLSQAVAG